MLEVFRSNKLDVLAAMLAAQLGREGALPEDPFLPLRVVVGSKGMERWLRHRLAASLPARICAHAEFPFPQQVLAGVLRHHEGGASGPPALDPWSADVLMWVILEVLPALLAEPDPGGELDHLRAYLEGEPAGPAGARTLALARQVAEVFDRLVLFRPEFAVEWSRGPARLPAGASDLRWQPRLWAAIRRHLAEHGAEVAHAAERWEAITRRRPPDPAAFDQPLRVFGVSYLPPASLGHLAWISRAVRVELYLVCPSGAWWAGLHGLGTAAVRALFDLDRDQVAEALSGIAAVRLHPLLSSLGRIGRDQQLVLERLGDAELERHDEAIFVDPAPELSMGAPPAPARTLHALQSDLLHLRDPAAFDRATLAARALDPLDDSLQFHACYGLTRQVEVLREALLHLFEAHPDLEPRDVLVMAPDIEACVPLVGAVFDQGRDQPVEQGGMPLASETAGEDTEKNASETTRWGRAGAPRIPAVVTERSVRRTNPVAEVLLRVLALASGRQRATSTAVLDLLALEPFRRRFGLEQADLEPIATWIAASGVRWGLDPADRARSEQPAEVQNTWRFGLERLALGVTMADAPGRLWDPPGPGGASALERAVGVAPYDALDAGALGGRIPLLGRFFDACATLFEVMALLGAGPEGRPLEAWVQATLLAQERLTDTAPGAAWLVARVRTELDGLRAQIQAAASARPLRIEAFVALLERRFEVASGATRAHGGAVTFASMLPYRSVPYRVICLLGVDEGAFPRDPARARFDLTHRSPRAGDHDPRDEDRHLLLEAILAARDHLLVFYTGRDPRTNEPRAPAVPIAELQAVLDASFPPLGGRRASVALTREHPLQPFSPRCFDATAGRPWSYDHDQLDACQAASCRVRALRPFFDPAALPPASPSPITGVHAEKPLLELPIAALARFLRNPTRALLADGLHLHLPPDQEPPPEREPIEPAGLERWDWSRRLLAERWARLAARWGAQGSAEGPAAGFVEGAPGGAAKVTAQGASQGATQGATRLRAEGLLPLGAGGARWAEAPAALVEALLSDAAAWFGDEASPLPPRESALEVSLELPTHRVRLLGAYGPVWQGDQVVVGIGDVEGQGKYRLEPWLRHLAWVASEGSSAEGSSTARTVLIFGHLDSHGVAVLQRAALELPLPAGAEPRAWAQARLAGLVGLFLAGQRSPLPLFERASWAFVKRSFHYGTQRFGLADLADTPPASWVPEQRAHLCAAWLAARQAFGADGEASTFAETDLDDPHVALAWTGLDPTTDSQASDPPLSPSFARLALRVWEPVFLGWTRDGKRTPVVPRQERAGGGP